MPITTRSSTRNGVNLSEIYEQLLSELQDTLRKGEQVQDDQHGTDSSSEDDNEEGNAAAGPLSIRDWTEQAQAMLATPAAPVAPATATAGLSGSSHAPENVIQQTDAWPIAQWEHQLAMPIPAAAGISNNGDAGFIRQRAQSAALAHAPVHDAQKAAKASAKVTVDTAGAGWFDMKAQPITEEVKRDWRLLRLRAAYDPKKFYKTFDSTKIPKHFQMGTVIAGSGEFYSARLTKRERKQTLAEELAADIKLKQERRRRYNRLQAERQELAKKRKKTRALHKRSKHRPKH